MAVIWFIGFILSVGLDWPSTVLGFQVGSTMGLLLPDKE